MAYRDRPSVIQRRAESKSLPGRLTRADKPARGDRSEHERPDRPQPTAPRRFTFQED